MSALDTAHWARQYSKSWISHTTYDNLSHAVADTNSETAYAVQYSFVAQLLEHQNLEIVGYKAALTAPQAQRAMGIDYPIIGALMNTGRCATHEAFQPQRAAILEVELGFMTNKAIKNPVTVENVLSYFASIHPMIEIAAPNLTQKPNAVDLVAANSASYAFVAGPAINDAKSQSLMTPQGMQILDNTDVSLCQGDTTLLSGKAGDVLGGQTQALVWLINTVLQQGYEISPEQYFMTGSIGGMTPAKPGSYTARYVSADYGEDESGLNETICLTIS